LGSGVGALLNRRARIRDAHYNEGIGRGNKRGRFCKQVHGKLSIEQESRRGDIK